METKKTVILMLLYTALMSVGCGEKGKSTKDVYEDLDTTKLIECERVSMQHLSDTIAVKPNSATLLFDASGSMHGYLKSSDDRFIGVIS